MGGEKSIKGLDRGFIAAIAAVGLVYYASYYDRGLNLLDEGYLIDPVMRVLRGELPYRDFHHFYAPGSFYLFAWIFSLTGPDLLVVRAVFALMHVLTAVLTYLCVRRHATPLVSLAFGLVMVAMPAVWHKAFFLLFPVLVTWLAFRYLDRPSVVRALFVGLSSGVAFIFRQDAGVYTVAAFTILAAWLWLAEARRDMPYHAAWFLLGVAAAVAPLCIFFAYHGALGAMLGDLLFSGQAGTKANSLPFPPVLPLWAGSLTATLTAKIFYIPFAVYLACVAVLARSWTTGSLPRKRGYLLFSTVMGTLVLLQLKNRSDLAHLWQVMPPVYIAAAGLLSASVTETKSTYRKTLTYTLLVAVLIWLGIVGMSNYVSGSIAVRGRNDCLLNEPRARVYVTKELAGDLHSTVSFIRDNMSGRPYEMLAAPDIPMLYFLADKRSPVSYELFRAGVTSSEDTQMMLVQEVEEKGVEWVVLNIAEAADGRPERRFSAHSPLLYGYLTNKFEPVNAFGNFSIRKRVSTGKAQK